MTIPAILKAIRAIESSDRYTLPPGPAGASGAYQYLPGTWAGYGGYQAAYLAPPSVQDAKAAFDVRRFLKSNGGNILAVPCCWFIGRMPRTQTEWDTIPRPDVGNTLTPRQYAAKWLAAYTPQVAHMLTPAVVANVDRMLTSGFANAPTPPCRPHVMAAAYDLVSLYGQGQFMAGWRDPRSDSIANGFHPRGLAVDWYVPRSPTGGLDATAGALVASWAWLRPDVLEVIYDGHIATVAHESAGWRIYTPPPGEGRHAEHIHISFAPAGETHSTLGRVPFPGSEWPDQIVTPPIPPTTEEEPMALLHRIKPFANVVTVAPGVHITGELATALLAGQTLGLITSEFHPHAIKSMLGCAHETGADLEGQEPVTDEHRAALAAVGITI